MALKITKKFENFQIIYRMIGTNKELDRELERILESYPFTEYKTAERSRVPNDDGTMTSTVTHFNDL